MNPLTTHVLDQVRGTPAVGIAVQLQRADPAGWTTIGAGSTDADGRVGNLLPTQDRAVGAYRLCFATGDYFAARNQETFYRQVVVEFELQDLARHYHVPLLLSPFGYSTYRGS